MKHLSELTDPVFSIASASEDAAIARLDLASILCLLRQAAKSAEPANLLEIAVAIAILT